MDTVKLVIILIIYLNSQIFCQDFPVQFWQPPEQQQPPPQWHQQQSPQWHQPQQQPQHHQQQQQQQQQQSSGAVPMPPPPPNFRFIPFENGDESERAEEVEARRWSLIPTRSTPTATLPPTTTTIVEATQPSTTSSTTTSTTTTTTTTPSSPTTQYYDPCEFYDDIALMNKLKQNGLFNSIYMAPDVFTAAKTFPDLGDRSFTISGGHKYECDEQCEKESKIIRGIIGSNSRRSVQRSQILRNTRLRTPRVTEAPRTWWRPANWRREKRDEGEDESPISSINITTTPSTVTRRKKRSAADLAKMNSGKTDGILGTTIALQCDEATTEDIPSNGYHLCRNCRAVRQLPETFFPRVLNEVICAEGNCLRGDGKCQQRYLPFRILQNIGNSQCPQWRETDIQIRTCCDCVIHPNSPFIKYIIPPD